MAIPGFQNFFLPVLRALADGNEKTAAELRTSVADQMQLSAPELQERLAGGTLTFNSRVGWAKTYLDKAGLLRTVQKGTYALTPAGKALLAEAPPSIDQKFLRRYDSFREFMLGGAEASEPETAAMTPTLAPVDTRTPNEQLEDGYRQLRKQTEQDLLQRVLNSSPRFFEELVVELLVRMGYGGSRDDAGKALGRSGDGGIDGVIKEDPLGLDAVYLQAKRWQNNVGRPEIQGFVGSLEGERARKGVFITTAGFTKEARDYAARIDKRVVLIDGQQLTSLMFEHGIGVTPVSVYEVKRLDGDYFDEE